MRVEGLLRRHDPDVDLCEGDVDIHARLHPHKITWVRVPGFRVQGPGFRVQGSGFRVQGAGCRLQGAGFREMSISTLDCTPTRSPAGRERVLY